MAIKRLDDLSDDEKVTLEINNGDNQILGEIVEQWKFKDKETALRFALAVLSKAKKRSVQVQNEAGEKITIEPAETLTRAEHGNAET
jgi:hypothetical protein